MATPTNTRILVSGEPITSFTQLVIEQKLNAHHKFSIVYSVPFELIGSSLEKAKQQVGAKVLITISPSQFSLDNELEFRGTVSEVKLLRAEGASAKIILNGYSPTYQMEGLPDTCSYSDKKISEIVHDIISKYPSDKLEPVINIANDEKLAYTVKYKESDFQFLSRLAAKKGLWFYFNGRQLVFGKPESRTVKMEYGKLLSDFNIGMRAKPVKFNFLGYDASSKKQENKSSDSVSVKTNTITNYLIENSKSFFPITSNLLYNNPITEENISNHLTERLKIQLQSQVSDLLVASGTSDISSLRLGDIINIQDSAFSTSNFNISSLTPQNYGSYYITDILHVCNESGNYYNNFYGIPVESECPPYGNVFLTPVAEAQSAIVMDNNDPKGLSRIRVQFPWQKESGEKTPWIRMLTPYAGSGKGMHVLPEIGEEVIVDFESNNAEKPVVLGALFNGQEKSGLGGQGNYVKGLQSVKGNKLQLNDKDGSTLLTDQPGSVNMKFDGSGNSSIGAATTQSITVGGNEEKPDGQAKLNMDNQGNITLDGATSLTITIGSSSLTMHKNGTINLKGKNITVEDNGKTVIDTKQDISIISNKNYNVKSNQEILISSDENLTITGGPSLIISSGDTNII